MLYTNVLSEEQKTLLPFIQSFEKEYYLVGGTAIKDIDHTEEIAFIAENSDSEEDVKAFLTSIAIKHI